MTGRPLLAHSLSAFLHYFSLAQSDAVVVVVARCFGGACDVYFIILFYNFFFFILVGRPSKELIEIISACLYV